MPPAAAGMPSIPTQSRGALAADVAMRTRTEPDDVKAKGRPREKDAF